MLAVTVAIGLFGFILAPLFTAGTAGAVLMMALGLILMGLTYGPLGTVISELFPTPVRYTGSSLAFSTAGILGASLAPYIATWLAKNYGLPCVGYYLTASALLTFIGLLLIRETKDEDLNASLDEKSHCRHLMSEGEAFRLGPLEWCWRSLTYWMRQPMRLAAPQPLPVQTAPAAA